MKHSTKYLALWVLFGLPFLAIKEPLERLGPALFSILGVALLAAAGTYIALRAKEWKRAQRQAEGAGEQDENSDDV